MRIREELARAIEAMTTRVGARELAGAAAELSSRYREGSGPGETGTLTVAQRAAYLAVRAPATYAAVSAVLDELRERCPGLPIASLLDLGAGPGVGAWAALGRFEQIADVTLVERDRAFVDLGRELVEAANMTAGRTAAGPVPDGSGGSGGSALRVSDALPATEAPDAVRAADASVARPPSRTWDWRVGDLRQAADAGLPRRDLVLISYAIGELDAAARRRLIAAAWDATAGALVVVEPGTPGHFAGLLDVRAQLIDLGASIVAPCPHAAACPMAATPRPPDQPAPREPLAASRPEAGAQADWCHFAVRLPRTALHRRLKGGALSYEDEKFSYVLATRAPCRDAPAAARIVRHPRFDKGRVTLSLCTPKGLATRIVTRAARDEYRRARKAAWGDSWGAPEGEPRENGAGDDLDS